MDIVQLKHFLSIAGTLHFGKSSVECNLSPSAFTRSIKRLESDLGYDLLERNNRSVELTREGELFRDYAAQILDKLKEFQYSAMAGTENLKGELSLFCTVTACYSILPAIIEDFRTLHPDVHIHLQTGNEADTMQRVVDNGFDVSITMMPDKLPGTIDFYPVTVTPLVFAAPLAETKFLKRDSRTIDPAAVPFILPEKGVARKRVDKWFADKGIQPVIYAQVAGNEAILAMVSLGCGIGVVPMLVIEKSPFKDTIRIIDTEPSLEPYLVGVCMNNRKKNNLFVNAFIELVRTKKTKGDFDLDNT